MPNEAQPAGGTPAPLTVTIDPKTGHMIVPTALSDPSNTNVGQTTPDPQANNVADTLAANNAVMDEAAIAKAAAEAVAAAMKKAQDAGDGTTTTTETTVPTGNDADTTAEAAKAAEAAAAAKKAELLAQNPTEYASFDDPSAQAAVNLLKESGVSAADANAIFAGAMASGDLNDVNIALLESKIGKDKATLVMSGVSSYHAKAAAQGEASAKAVYDELGGEQNWNTVRDWARAKEAVDPSFKGTLDAVREMLGAGEFQARAAAQQLTALYNADSGTATLTASTANLMHGKPAASAIGAPMSRADYVAAIQSAEQKGLPAAHMEQLHARRRAGMQQGL